MKLANPILLSLLISGISGAAIRDEQFKRDVLILETAKLQARENDIGLAGPNQSNNDKRSFGSLLGTFINWLHGDSSSSGTTTATAATAVAAANTATVATTTPTTTVSAVETELLVSSAAATSDEEDSDGNGIFDLYDTLFGRTKTKTSATTTADLTAGVSATFSAGVTFSASVSVPTATESSSSGYDEVETYAKKGAGISYSPYTKGGACKTSSEVESDISMLSSFGIIRLYGVDCSGVENVLASISSSQKLFVGIYNIDEDSINTDLTTLKEAVEGSSRGWSAVHTVSIGNELVNAGSATPSEIATAVENARSWFDSNASSYSGYIVSVDTLVAVKNNPSLCDVSDYLAVNCHPFWDGGVEPSNSGPWLEEQISALQDVCGSSKKVFITESGWPTQGDSYGNCVPSKQNQLLAIESIATSLGDDVLMFTTYNDYWKDGGSYGVEKYWGIFGDPEY